MTRDERRSAIAGPVGVGGAEIDPVLLTRLVNDVGDNPDQLSILQHALNRTWARWRHDGGSGALALRHYEAVGTMAHALNQHAEEAFSELAEGRPRALAEALFKAITDKVTDARGTRRPTRLDTLGEVTGASAAELTPVIDVFRDPSRSFLMPPAGTALRPDSPIDISHESLMRVWDRLRAWADEEARSAQTYRRLAEIAELERAGSAGLLRQPDLQFAIDWQRRQQPNAAWAGRYRAGFEATTEFLKRSAQAYQDERRKDEARARQWRWIVGSLIGGLAAVAASLLWFYLQAEEAQVKAQAAQVEAEESRNKAKVALGQAEASRIDADKARAQLESTLNVLRRQSDWATVYQQAVRTAPDVRRTVEQAVQSRSLTYLQYADPDQKDLVERLRLHLEKAGYAAPGSERVNAVPSRSELRYFREADAGDAAALAELLARWNWGVIKPIFVKGYTRTQPRQIELWLARPDAAQIGRLLQQINVATPEERNPVVDRYPASPLAIAQTLALISPERIDALSPSGLINALYFLTRTAPLAWDPALEASAREIVGRIRSRAKVSYQTSAELERLTRLLDAVRAGEAAPPVANRLS
jgi:hypothetical protein